MDDSVRRILRLEGLTALAASVTAYALWSTHGWLFFAFLLLAPDLSAVGYLRNPRVGARVYNAVHTYAAPALLAGASALLHARTGIDVAMIWAAHIGMDRAVGYGLKLPTSFQATHLGMLGRKGLPG